MRLLRRHIHNVVDDIRREMPLREAQTLHRAGRRRALRGRTRCWADAPRGRPAACSRASPSSRFCDQITVVRRRAAGRAVPPAPGRRRDAGAGAAGLPRAADRDVGAESVIVPDASLRAGLLLDLAQSVTGAGDRGLQPAGAGQRRPRWGRSTATTRPTRRHVAALARAPLRRAPGRARPGRARARCCWRWPRCCTTSGNYVNLRGHHKHTQYLLSVSEIFGLGQDDMAVVGERGTLPPARAAPRSRTCPTWRSTARRA